MLPRGSGSWENRSPGVGAPPFGWADLAVVPLVVALSLPVLDRFGDSWTVGKDAVCYLFAGSEIVSGQSLHTTGGIISNGGHGPVFPAMIGSLILVFGRDVGTLAWAVRLLAVLNALLAYLLARRVSGRLAGLIAAALLTLFGSINLTFNIDTVLLAFCLLALLALMGATSRNSTALALLSGVLLGVAILMKESAVVYLPLAVLAMLLLDWEVRGALWHYLGLVIVCLPWWAWYYSAAGGLYLLDRLPPSLQLLLPVAAAVLLAIGALAYATGALGAYFAGEGRRRWTGWLIVLAWTSSLTGLALYAGAPALAEISSKSLSLYLSNLLAPELAVVPVLALAFGYALWKALFRGDGPWTLLALALLFQVPVCVLVAVEEWHHRQYLVLAALVFCALAGLVVDAASASWRGERVYATRLPGALTAVVLIVLLLVASVERVEAQLPEDRGGGTSGRHEVSPQAARMADWMAENVPRGQNVSILPAYSLNNYLMFLDGGRHGWTFLRMDQQPCKPRPNGSMRCNPNDISRISPDAIWVHVGERSNASSLSMSNLIRQLRRTHSGYLMVSGGYKFPGIMGLPSRLQDSGAFEVGHSELDKGTSGRNESLVLMKSTGRKPKAVPTLMNAKTALRLKRYEKAEGTGYAERIRSGFPNGIRLPSGTWVSSART